MERLKKLSESYKWVEKIANKSIIEILKTYDIFQEIHSRFFNQYDISNARFNILVIVYKAPKEGIFLTEISEKVLLSNSNITRLADSLEKQGYIKRYRNTSDRRKIAVRITPEGKSLIEEIIEEYIIWCKKITSSLDYDEKIQLVNLLHKLHHGIIQLHKEEKII